MSPSHPLGKGGIDGFAGALLMFGGGANLISVIYYAAVLILLLSGMSV